MQGKHWIALLWIASLAGAWLGGRSLAGPAAPETSDSIGGDEISRLKEQIAVLEAAREAQGPLLEARGVPSDNGSRPAGDALGAGKGAAGNGAADAAEAMQAIDFAKINTPEEFSRAFLAFARTMLARGREGHLELLAWIGNLGRKENEQHFERIFAAGGERALPGALYPVVKFAIENDKQVIALTETFFEQAAEKPSWFEGMDDDPFELFTQGIGMVAPAIADKEQLARLRGYAKAILEQDEASQPKAIQRNRRDLERLLLQWAPPLSPEEILAKLQAGTLSDAEIMSLLPTLPPEALKLVDIDRYLGPRIEKADWQAVRILRGVRDLDTTTRARLDQRVYRGAASDEGSMQGWFISQYLQATGRRAWADQRLFFETGLGLDLKAADRFAAGVMQLGSNGPDKEWVRWVLGRFTLSENVATQLRTRFKITD